MTRQEVLSGGRPDSAESVKIHRGVRQYDRDMRKFRGIAESIEVHGCGRTCNNPASELTDAQLLRRVGDTPGKLTEPKSKPKKPRRIFSKKTELILKAACAQYLGHYPTQIPSKSEIKTMLKEMARMHSRSWKNGFECMEHQFHGTEKAIREIQRYASRNEILPESSQ